MIKVKDINGAELKSFIYAYIQEREHRFDIESPLTGCVMDENIFDSLCAEMDARIIKMTIGIRRSVQQSGRAHVRPLLLELIDMIPRLDERVVLSVACQRVFGGVQ